MVEHNRTECEEVIRNHAVIIEDWQKCIVDAVN